MNRSSRFASLVAAGALLFIGAQAQAGQASGNLAIGITITSSCALSSDASGQSLRVKNHNCDGINSFRVDRESNGARSEAPLSSNSVSEVKGTQAAPTVVTLYW